MDAAWNDEVSPYDVLGVSEDATDEEIRQAYRDLAKLFHPDRNFGLGEETTNRTSHFLKIKKAYEALADEGSRRLYDGCLVARERLVRKNIYKYAVSNTSEFRDVVDEQFRDAVLDPEREIGQGALVLCCDSCGAPSKFRCSVCDMLVCAFCSLKEHASEGIPPHYPCKHSPKFRKQIEASGRRQRLLNSKEQERKPWLRSEATKNVERRTFKQATSKVGRGEIAGTSSKHARLSTCYGWLQSPAAIILAVWVQGDVNQVDVDLASASATGKTTSLSIRQSSGNFKPVLDGRILWGSVDESCDVECATFDALHVIALKIRKAHYGELWPACFDGDSHLLRDAGDHDVHEWIQEDDGDIILRVQVPRTATTADLEVDVSAKSVTVQATNLLPWTRHFAFDCLPEKSTWSLLDADNRRVVEFSLVFSNMPKEIIQTDKNRDVETVKKIDLLFVEDEDRLFTMALAQVCARLDYGDRFMTEDELLPDASSILEAMRGKNGKTQLPPSAFSRGKEDDPEKIKTWYTRHKIQAERSFLPTSEPKKRTNQKNASSPTDPLLPAPSDGARGPPTFQEASPSVDDHEATPDLFGGGLSRVVKPVSTFAWDDTGSSVKVYLSLPVEDLVVEDVAVRFRPDRLCVQVKDDNTLFSFDTSLFQPVVPSKCTFKCVEHKKVVSLGLRKKNKLVTWPSLAKNVNAHDTVQELLPSQ